MDTQCIFYRSQQDGTWNAWTKLGLNIPAFYKNYANESSLAAALGGVVTDLGTVSTINNIITPGNYFVTTTADCQGSPVMNAQAANLQVIYSSGNRCLQIFTAFNENVVWIRLWTNSLTWTDWKQVSTDIPSFYKDYNDINSLASGIDNPNLSRFSLQYGQALKVSFINTFSNATSMELEVIWSGTHSTIFVSQQMSYGIGYNPSFPLFYFDDANNDFYIKSSQQADISVFIKHPRSLTCQVVTAPDVTWNATRQISYTGS